MSSAASVLNQYNWERLRPGENDSSFKFEGPGVVILAEETKGPTEFQILDVVATENDALGVAKSMLSQHRSSDCYRFAMLGALSSKAERRDVAAELSKYRKGNGDS